MKFCVDVWLVGLVSLCFLCGSALAMCNVEYYIGGEDCEICSILDGIDACMTDTSCLYEDSIHCSLSSVDGLSGNGNTNISLTQTTKLKSLELSVGNIAIDGGFFMFIRNSLQSLSIKSPTIISGSTQTALSFISDDSTSSLELENVSFKNCESFDDYPPALLIDTPGTIKMTKTLFRDTSSSSHCGAAMFQLYESTTIVNDIYSTSMNFIDTVAAGNGGGLCLFGSPGSNVTLRGPIFTGTSAINGGGIYIRGPGSFTVNFLVDEYTTMATNGSLLYAEEFDSVTISESLFSIAWFGTGNSLQNGAMYLTSSVPSSQVNINDVLLEGSEVRQNGGAFYIKDVDTTVVTDSVFVSCWANSGIGGALLFDGVDNINITGTRFQSNSAGQGASLACVGNSLATNIYDVSFQDSISFYADESTIDVYSDGSCSDAFWYSQTPCSISCNSCSDDVCGKSTLGCSCYCDSDDCIASESTVASVHSSSYTAFSLTEYTQQTGDTGVDVGTTVAWSFLGLFCVLVIIVIIGLLVAFVSVRMKNYYTSEYERLEVRSSSTQLVINSYSDDDD